MSQTERSPEFGDSQSSLVEFARLAEGIPCPYECDAGWYDVEEPPRSAIQTSPVYLSVQCVRCIPAGPVGMRIAKSWHCAFCGAWRLTEDDLPEIDSDGSALCASCAAPPSNFSTSQETTT